MVTAWMRVQLMGDTALRSWFYGPSCKLCTDAGWQVLQIRRRIDNRSDVRERHPSERRCKTLG